jgi:hypothetical protein
VTHNAPPVLVNPLSDTPTAVASWFEVPTWGRRPNLDLVMAHVRERFPRGGGLLIEVGSMRTPGNVEGDGCASVAWATLARETGHLALSLDVDPLATGYADRLRRYGLPIVGVHGKASEVLRDLGVSLPVHLLYLDGSDDPLEALDQLGICWPRLANGALVVVDDARPKAAQVARYMAGAVERGEARPFPGFDAKWNQVAWEIVR